MVTAEGPSSPSSDQTAAQPVNGSEVGKTKVESAVPGF